MFGRLFIDLLIDRLKSSGVPAPKGISMAAYEPGVDREELAGLIDAHANCWRSFGYQSSSDRTRLARTITERACQRPGVQKPSKLFDAFADTTTRLISTEPAFFPFPLTVNISTLTPLQMGEISRDLYHRIRFLTDKGTQQAAFESLQQLHSVILESIPKSVAAPIDTGTPSLTTELLSLMDKPFDVMTSLLSHFISNDDIQDRGLYQTFCRQLYRNILDASGIIVDPDRPLSSYELKNPKLPIHFTKEPAATVAARFFANTPLLGLLTSPVPFSIPESVRFEHMHIIAGTGHGKTQTLQHLIVSDLQRPAQEVPAMVILDSQGDMLAKLQRLALFDPMIEDSLAHRLLIVDPSDVEFAPSLNLFDIQSDRLKDYSQKDREQVLAGIIEIYDYIFGGLLGADLSQKQAVVFRFLAQLMLSIPDSTIHTLRDLLIDATPFMEHVAKLPETARGFFETQFFASGYKATREQILRRLYGVLQNPSFERMFAGKQNRLDLFEVLNGGGIVLVNSAKDFMKTESSSMFGRYIIALTFKAAMERAILPEHQRRPTFLWIDEASEYFDDKIDDLLIQARKYKLGLIMAHQYLGQLPKGLPASIMTNTSIKLAGGISYKDTMELSREMRTSPEFVSAMGKHEDHADFAAFVRNVTPQAIKLTLPFGTLESLPRMPDEHFEILLNASRRRLSPLPVAPIDEEPTPDSETASAVDLLDEDEFWEEDL